MTYKYHRTVFASVLAVLAVSFLGAGCASRVAEAERARDRGFTVAERDSMGVVIMVPNDRFVVLNFAGFVVPQRGTELEIVREGKVIARVRTDAASAEYSHLVTADVLDGSPQRGDFIRRPASKPQEGAPPAGQPQAPRARQNFGPR